MKFRIMEPQSYAGTEGEVMLSSAFTEDQLANVPRAGERRQVRIDSEALAAIIEKRDRKLVDGDPPFQAFRYFFMIPETGKEPNQALQTTSVTRSGFGKVSVSDRQRRGV